MTYSTEILLTQADCDIVIADTNEEIEREQFNITALQRSATLRTGDATEDAEAITALTDQITPLETRIAGMTTGSEARTKAELQLRALRRDREALQDAQLKQGARAAFRRLRALDSAQRQLAGLQDCLAQVTARRAALPA